MLSSDYKFVWADVSGKGSSSDVYIYNNNDLKDGLENDDIMGWPRPDPIPNDNQHVSYSLAKHDAFSLRTYLMKPYSARNLTKKHRIFNYRLSRARRVFENAFGILANSFLELLTTMCHDVETVRLIVRVCNILQNRLLDNQG